MYKEDEVSDWLHWIDFDLGEFEEIEKFLLRYHRVPERAFVWRGTMFIETVEGER